MAESENSGIQLERYELLEKLGVGPLGTTYKAKDRSTGETVAVKVFHPSVAAQREFVRKVTRMVGRAREVEHSALARYIEAGSEHDVVYVVREYIDGLPLSKALAQAKVPEKTALALGSLVGSVLEAAASADLTHGRIKPSNLVVTKDKRIKLTDFSIPRPPDPPSDPEAAPALLEEAQYLAPEQVRAGSEPDARSDLYSLGVVLWHALTGRKPFRGDVPGAVLVAHLSQRPESPHQAEPTVTMAASDLVMRLMQNEPAARYENPAAFMADLKEVQAGRAPSPGHPAAAAASAPSQAPTAASGGPTAGEVATGIKFYAIAGVLFLIAGVLFYLGLEPAKSSRKPVPAAATTPTAAAKTPAGTAKKPATEAPAAPSPVIDSRDSAAEVAYREAEAYAKEHPKDANEILRRYQLVKDRFPGTLWAAKSYQKYDAVRAGMPSDFDVWVDAQRELAKARIAQNQYNEALLLFSNPPQRFSNPECRARLDEERATIKSQADEAYAKLKADADVAAQDKDFAKARKVYSVALLYGLTSIADDVEQQMQKLDVAEGVFQKEQSLKRAELYAAFRKEVTRVLADHSFAKALDLMRAVQEDPNRALLTDWAKADEKDTQELAAFWNKVIEKLPSLVGKRSPAYAWPGVVSEVKGETIVVQLDSGQGTPGVRLSMMTEGDLVRTVEKVTDLKSAPDRRGMVLLLLSMEQYGGAQKQLAQASDSGMDLSDLSASMDRLSDAHDSIVRVPDLTPDRAQEVAVQLARQLRRDLRCVSCGGSGDVQRNQPPRIATEDMPGQQIAKGDIIPGKTYFVQCPRCMGLKFYYNTSDVTLERKKLQAVLDKYAVQLAPELAKEARKWATYACVAEAFELAYDQKKPFPYDEVLKNPRAYPETFFYVTGRVDAADRDRDGRMFLILSAKAEMKAGKVIWSQPVQAFYEGPLPDKRGKSYFAVVGRVSGLTKRQNKPVPQIDCIFVDEPRLLPKMD